MAGVLMKKAGIMGGTFNPVHIGHLIAAQEVLEALGLDYILFLPTGNPPHKAESEVIESIHRYGMVEAAIKDNGNFIVNDIEIKREGKTYTYDTLMELRMLYSDTKFYFLMGYDTLRDMDTWKRVEDVFKLAKFVVVNRGNHPTDMEAEIEKKRCRYGAEIIVVNIPEIEISSTEIRNRICSGNSIKYLVPESVEKYITTKRLYRGEINERL
jgi:nicotinate-nucleotide adenylyltransferase